MIDLRRLSTDPLRDGDPGALALDLALLFGLGAALLYAAGWAYAYRWYGRFDLGLNGLDLPAETVLMYGFWVLREHWYLLLFVVAGSLGWSSANPGFRRWAIHAAPVLLILAFVIVYAVASLSADKRFEAERDAGFSCLPKARVGLIDQDRRTPAIADLARELAERDSGDAYRLLLQTDSLLVLIKPKPQGPPVPVLVPLSSVDAVRLGSVVTGCD